MTAIVGQAKQEEAVAPVLQSPPLAAGPITRDRRNEPISYAPGTGENVMDFVRANRIHVKNGSLFIDPYLVLHPRELDPKNDRTLRDKLDLTYGINNPSFFESPERVAIALNLGQLLPVSLQAKRSRLMEEVGKFNAQVDTGTDADLQQAAKDKREPFAAIVRDTVENPNVDPVGLELLKNSLAMYLLCRQKLTLNHYMEPLTNYVTRMHTPDQILSDLDEKLGVTPQQIREAALSGGIDGVGKLLGLDPAFVADVKQVVDRASQNDFSHNLLEHWHWGRQLVEDTNASMDTKIAAGKEARIEKCVNDFRARARGFYDVPEPIKREEERIAKALELVDPIQRKLMFKLGYEICFTPEMTADEIAFHKGVYGLHRKAANDLSDVRGTYRIYFSGHGDLESSMRTLVHEIAHNLWPDHFTKQDVAAIDKLAGSDAARFVQLNKLLNERFGDFEKLLNAYNAGDAQEKAAVIKAANNEMKSYGITVDKLFPHLTDAHGLQFMVRHALDTLQVEGDRYNRSGYDTPQERFREVLSRFAELKQVRFRNQPELLDFIAPGLNEIFDKHYLPHLERVYNDISAGRMPSAMAASEAPEVPPSEEHPKVKEQPNVGQVHGNHAPQRKIQLDGVLHQNVALAPALQALGAMGLKN